MASNTQYKYNPTTPPTITRELYNTVGAGDNFVGEYPYAIKGGTDFEIWDSAVGGTQLTEGVDYELRRYDSFLSARAGFDIYGGYRILTPAYQSGNIYITYKIVRSYNAAAIPNDLRSRILALETNPAAPRGYISGYEIANNAIDADHDIDISAGVARDGANTIDIVLSSSLTKQIDAAWAAGTNAGGLDTGSVANNTFYYIWAIRNPTTTAVDILFSASKTSPTMPAGYTQKRRIRGVLFTDGSANIRGFYQKDNVFRYKTFIQDVSDATPGTSRKLAVVSVPPEFIGLFTININNASNAQFTFGNPQETDTVPAATYNIMETGTGGNNTQMQINILTNSSSQIYYRSTDGTMDNYIKIFSLGFIDNAEV